MQIEPLQTTVTNLRESVKRLAEVEARIEQFAGAAGDKGNEINEAHRTKGQRDRESRALSAIQKAITGLAQQVHALKGMLGSEVSPLIILGVF